MARGPLPLLAPLALTAAPRDLATSNSDTSSPRGRARSGAWAAQARPLKQLDMVTGAGGQRVCKRARGLAIDEAHWATARPRPRAAAISVTDNVQCEFSIPQ